MLSFIIFVAVTNLFLGLLLGWMIHGIGPLNTSANLVSVVEQDGTKSVQATRSVDGKTVAVEQRARQGDAVDAHQGTHENPLRVEKSLLSPLTADESTPVELSDSKRQLQQAKENIRYVRTTQDKGLAREIAARLRSLVMNWHAQLQQSLNESLECESVESNAECPDLVALEMCLAQIESTVSNIDAIDWKDQVSVILDGIERETELIAKSQLLK